MAEQAAAQMTLPVFFVPDVPATPTPDRTAWQRAMLTSGLRSATKLVALTVSVHAVDGSDPGIAACAPGLPALVEESGYGRSHVLRQVKLLREHGWLSTIGRPAPGRATVYGLTLPAATSPPPRPARIVSDRPSAAARRQRRARGRIPVAALDALVSGPCPASGLVDLLTSLVDDGPAAPAVRTPVIPITVSAPAAPAPAEPAVPAAPTPAAPVARVAQGPIPGTSAPAAAQVLAAVARAMRCGVDLLESRSDEICTLLDAGTWLAVELAAHLADGLPAVVDGPAEQLGERLTNLPASSADCACRPCRSWQPSAGAPAAPPARRRPAQSAGSVVRARPVAAGPAPALPDLASIEQAAAAGTAQARRMRDNAVR